MIALLTAVAQLVFLILNNYFEKDKEEKSRKADLHAKLADAIKRNDRDAINDLLTQLHT